jgi:galactitol PTS system EIIA component
MTKLPDTRATRIFDVSEDLTLFNVQAETNEAVIRQLAALFSRDDVVHDTYLDAVLQREKVMPTGLATKVGGVALPHTDSEHVKRSAIAIARLANPVKFNNMANPAEQVEVNIVFLLAIAQKEQINPFLGKMAELLQDEPAFRRLLAFDSAKEFIGFFKSQIHVDESAL